MKFMLNEILTQSYLDIDDISVVVVVIVVVFIDD